MQLQIKLFSNLLNRIFNYGIYNYTDIFTPQIPYNQDL